MTKREATLVGTTFLVTSAFFVIAYFLIGKTAGPGDDGGEIVETPPPRYIDSDTITWRRAQELTRAYRTPSKQRFRVRHNGRDGTGPLKNDTLQGFVFKASNLDSLLNFNASGRTPDHVIFYFGKAGEFEDPAGEPASGGKRKSADIQVIAIGIRNDTLLNGLSPSTGIATPAPQRLLRAAATSVYDKANPCPPFCPTVQMEQ